MSNHEQPWNRVVVDGKRCRVQVLDPLTAFDLEGELVERFGEPAIMMLAARAEVLGSVWANVLADHGCGSSLRDALADPERGVKIAADGISRMAAMAMACIIESRIDGRWLSAVCARMLWDRVRVGDRVIEDWDDLTAAGVTPLGRWSLFAAQVSQTYHPLWVRTPYSLRTKKHKDYGVPLPSAVSKAMQWATNLAAMGYASSADEILRRWTPAQLLDTVDVAAFRAETERRVMDAAQAGG